DRRDQVIGGGFAGGSKMARISRALRPAVLRLSAGSAVRDFPGRNRLDRRRRLWRASTLRGAGTPLARADAQTDDGAVRNGGGAADQSADRSAGIRFRRSGVTEAK